MLSPRRAIKLRKSQISRKRHFSTFRPLSRPNFGNLTKYPKIGRLGGRNVEKYRFFEIRDFLNLIALRGLNMKFYEF